MGVLQLTSSPEELTSLDHYIRKTFFKTASLMANSCKAIALLGGQTQEACAKAWDYGRHLGLAFQVRIPAVILETQKQCRACTFLAASGSRCSTQAEPALCNKQCAVPTVGRCKLKRTTQADLMNQVVGDLVPTPSGKRSTTCTDMLYR